MTEEGSFSPDRPHNPRCLPTCAAEASDGSPSHGAVDFSVAVVLPAGGSGERMGISTPKQFSRILNRPLISYTVQAFERLPWIGVIVVVVAKENHDLMLNIVRTFNHTKVKVVDGGSSRHRSIFCGLQAFNECSDSSTEKPKVVIIHDAVRPFVEADLLMKIALSAKEQGASGAIRPLVSTVISTTAEGFLDHSLERAKYRASEMPQAFLYDIIFQAYQRCSEFDLEFGTECLHLALQYCGTNAKLIDGPPTLWKVTYKRDLAAAESIIKETLSMSVCIIPEPGAVALTRALQKHLATQNVVVTDMSQAKQRQADYLIETHNFIHISVNGSNLSVIEETVGNLEDRDHARLYPVVIVWVLLSITAEARERPNPEKFMSLAAELAERNILLYGIHIHHSKVPEQWERSVGRLAGIFIALIRERSTALTGQMLQA